MADSSTTPPANVQGDHDPLTGLHRMSTTAGVGSQEYVAINGTAIAAVLLGAGSLLALLGNVLLVVPAVGILCGLVALNQIRHSGGTQSGRPLAWTGIVLSVLIGGWVVGAQLVEAARDRGERAALVQVIEQLGVEVKDQQWDAAYALFTADFQHHVNKDMFITRLRMMRGNEVVGTLQRTGSNNLVKFDHPPGGELRAQALILFYFDKSDVAAPQLSRFRKTNAGWRIDAVGDLFQTQAEAEAAAEHDHTH